MTSSRATPAPVGAPSPVLLATLAVGGLVAAGLSLALALNSDHVTNPWVQAGLFIWIELSYLVSGLIAWWRRPESRFGRLMVLAGFGAFLTNLAWANNPVLFTIGQACDLLLVALFLHVFLAFPTGRLHGRVERVLVGAGYAVSLGLQLIVMLLGGFGSDNLLAAVDAPAAANAVHAVELILMSGLSLAGVGVLAYRRRAGGRPLRRSAALLVDAFAFALVAVAATLIMGIFVVPGFAVAQRIMLVMLGLAPVAFLIGLLNARLARTAMVDLLVELRGMPTDLRPALARALRDPSVSLVYWLPQYGSWVDQEGEPVVMPAPDGRRAVTTIERDGEPVAALIHHAALSEEPELLDAVGAAAGMAIDNGRLRAELRASLSEVRESRVRVIEAGQQERRRLERDLHDGAQQRLVALSMRLGMLEARMSDDPAARESLADAKREVAASLAELRDVAHGLYPAVLSGHGLEVALESLAARAPVPVQLTVRVDGRLPESVEVAAYYVVAESLTNIGKHARADTATVDVSRDAGTVVAEIVDDGVGGADTEAGSGLRGLADRVEALGGSLRVWTPRGGGTRVRAEIPCG